MILDRRGCELIKCPTTNQPAPVEVSLDDGTTWLATEDVAAAEGILGGVTFLIAGPDCDDPGDATVLEIGYYSVLGRMIDDPETVFRGNGHIRVR